MYLFSKKLYKYLDDNRLIEEMDKMCLEAQFIDIDQPGTSFSFLIPSCTVILSGSAYLAYKYGSTAIFGIGGLFASFYYFNRKIWKKFDAPNALLQQVRRCRHIIKKRQQISFGISMKLPSIGQDLVNDQCCQVIAEAIRIFENESEEMSKKYSKSEQDFPLWKELYTDEIAVILESYNEENLNMKKDVDVDTVIETLVSILRLHISEFFRILIFSIFRSENLKDYFKELNNFSRICSKVEILLDRLKGIESIILRGNSKSRRHPTGHVPHVEQQIRLNWEARIAIALDSILRSLESGNMNRSDVELALRKILAMLVEEQKLTEQNGPSKGEVIHKNDCEKEAIDFNPTDRERTDIDMVFEGVTLTDKEKKLNEVSRNLLELGSENRKHHQNLFGELQLALEPRRSDFEKRERTALAKWYGIDEEELREDEEKFEGDGIGGENGVEMEEYNWRTDAEKSEGIHRTVDDGDFLAFLSSHKVPEDLIE